MESCLTEPPRSGPAPDNNPCQLRQPGLGLLAELATDDDFQEPLERLLDAVCTLSGALHGVVRFPQGRSGRSYVLAQSGKLGILDADAIEQACFPLASDHPCTSLRVAGGKVATVHTWITPLHSLRDGVCGNLVLFFAESEQPVANAEALQGALGKVLGMALETSWRAEQNSERMRAQLCAALTQERQLLANEVHDTLAQNLTSMRMRAKLLKDALEHDEKDRASKYLAEIDEALTVAHGRVRQLITQFRAAMAPGGLIQALKAEIASLDGLAGVQLVFDSRLDDIQLPAEQELQILHIVREAVTNVVKHSQARHGQVTLEHVGQRLCVSVEDDGIGLEGGGKGSDSDYGHYGLNIMRERAARVGGEVAVLPGKTRGTRVVLSLPLTSRN